MIEEGFKRKLTAILSADVEGYSHLMDDDEESTIRTLTDYRSAMTTLIQQYRGRVVDALGDNLLAEFASAVDAVNCAVEIQRELAERNAKLSDERKMYFRIGVNVGDVVEEGDRIYGDGVNIAARLEGLAEKGGICISGTAFDQVKNKLSFRHECQGEKIVKNIKEPVRLYKVLMEKDADELIFDKKLRLPEKPSIAVLPFVNMSGATFRQHEWRPGSRVFK
jgi:adenylate cyclase